MRGALSTAICVHGNLPVSLWNLTYSYQYFKLHGQSFEQEGHRAYPELAEIDIAWTSAFHFSSRYIKLSLSTDIPLCEVETDDHKKKVSVMDEWLESWTQEMWPQYSWFSQPLNCIPILAFDRMTCSDLYNINITSIIDCPKLRWIWVGVCCVPLLRWEGYDDRSGGGVLGNMYNPAYTRIPRI
jgi:hypothetical protein